jgi:hypothetical protein
MMDMYSRYVEAVPINAASSEEVARGLFHGWISRHGCPETILSDQGSNFTSKMMNRLLGILGIDKLTTSAYHPQTNGRLERFHRSFSPMLMSLLKDEKRRNNWDEYIQHVIFVINTTQADSHEQTPFEVARGFVPTLPSDVLWGTANAALNFSADFHINLPLTMRVARQSVIEFQKRYDEDRFKRAFRDRHAVHLKVGDFVMLHRPPITAHDDSGKRMEGIPTKFLLRWSGPHPILHNPFPNVYTIGLEGNDKDGWSKTTTVNVARLLSYIPFKHSSAPSILRASVEARKRVAAAAAVPSRQSVAMFFVEQERIFLSSIGWNALARVSPSSYLSIEQKKSEEKRLRYFNKHIRVLRQRFGFDSTDDSTKEPVYLTCAEAQARITDLTAYVSHIMEFNNFYDTALVLRDFSETKIYAPTLSINSSVMHE